MISLGPELSTSSRRFLPPSTYTYTPPPTPAPHTRTFPTTVFYDSACSSTTPSHVAQQTSTHSSPPQSRKSTSCRIGLDPFLSPLKRGRFALSADNLQSGVECNCDEFKCGPLPLCFKLLLFQMPMQAQASYLRHHRGSVANPP